MEEAQGSFGRSELPLREAIAFSFQSLTLRLGRMVVVVLGISLHTCVDTSPNSLRFSKGWSLLLKRLKNRVLQE